MSVELFKLDGKVALVTGRSGLGREMALGLCGLERRLCGDQGGARRHDAAEATRQAMSPAG